MNDKEMDYFHALYDVARVINASLDPSRVLDEIVQCVAKAMRVKACSLRLLDSREKKLIMGAVYGLSETYLHKGRYPGEGERLGPAGPQRQDRLPEGCPDG